MPRIADVLAENAHPIRWGTGDEIRQEDRIILAAFGHQWGRPWTTDDVALEAHIVGAVQTLADMAYKRWGEQFFERSSQAPIWSLASGWRFLKGKYYRTKSGELLRVKITARRGNNDITGIGPNRTAAKRDLGDKLFRFLQAERAASPPESRSPWVTELARLLVAAQAEAPTPHDPASSGVSIEVMRSQSTS